MKKLFSPWWLLAIAVSGTALLAWAYWGGWNIHPHANAGELGQLGDFFGGMLNPLVSALTLFVAISVWRLQKDELELTRKELENSRLAMEEQAATAEQQRQEQRFFDLLNVYYRTVDSISFSRREIGPLARASEKYTGKFAISAWIDASTTIQKLVENRGSSIAQKGDKHNEDAIEQINSIVFVEWKRKDAREYFDSYFRVVRHLLSEAQGLLGDQHFRYIALFCAQLSRSEIILLALHLWLDHEGQEVHHLAGKYGLLRNLPKGDLHTELENDLPPEVFMNVSATTSHDPLLKESITPC